MRTASEQVVEVCSMRVGRLLLGVPILSIVEVLHAPALQPVPLAAPAIAGLVHYRGEVVTAVSMRRLLEREPVEGMIQDGDHEGAHHDGHDVLIFYGHHGDGQHGYFGLVVDAVGEVHRVEETDFEANPSTMDERSRQWIAGAYKLPEELLLMLHPERIDPVCLAGSRWEQAPETELAGERKETACAH